jgi:ABC-type polysaccharide/polyol phosphate export permease
VGQYLQEIWRCRYFWLSLVKMDLRTRYRRSVLGLGWSLLQPMAMTAVLCLVFHAIMQVNVREYGPYLMAGLAWWNYVLNTTLTGCQCLFRGEGYIRQYPAPMAIYPLRTALGGMVHFLIALGVAVGLSWLFQGFANVPVLLTLLPSLLLLFAFGWALATLAGFATVWFNDTQHLAEVGFQILFYATPIMYKADMLRGSRFHGLLQLNPLIPLLDLVRDPIVSGTAPTARAFLTAALIVAATSVLAAWVMSRLQKRIIFQM